MDDIERCARTMGMKPSEVREVVPADGGDLVRTHDGQWTLIRDDGVLIHRADPPAPLVDADEASAQMLAGFRGEPEVDDEPAKPAPKRRGRA